ncbi:MAG: hypothetical protein ACLP29_03720 [Dissulfurispiraceae bacterium]
MDLGKMEGIVREKFFSKWDRKRVWQITYGSRTELHGADGICDRKKQLIVIKNSGNETDLLNALIHEICHAVTSDYHGKLFLKRLSKAGHRAKYLGYEKLSEAIHTEVHNYTNNKIEPTAQMIYGDFQDAALDQPDISFSTIATQIAREYGMSKNEFLLKFNRAEQVFTEAQRIPRDLPSARLIKRRKRFQ